MTEIRACLFPTPVGRRADGKPSPQICGGDDASPEPVAQTLVDIEPAGPNYETHLRLQLTLVNLADPQSVESGRGALEGDIARGIKKHLKNGSNDLVTSTHHVFTGARLTSWGWDHFGTDRTWVRGGRLVVAEGFLLLAHEQGHGISKRTKMGLAALSDKEDDFKLLKSANGLRATFVARKMLAFDLALHPTPVDAYFYALSSLDSAAQWAYGGAVGNSDNDIQGYEESVRRLYPTGYDFNGRMATATLLQALNPLAIAMYIRSFENLSNPTDPPPEVPLLKFWGDRIGLFPFPITDADLSPLGFEGTLALLSKIRTCRGDFAARAYVRSADRAPQNGTRPWGAGLELAEIPLGRHPYLNLGVHYWDQPELRLPVDKDESGFLEAGTPGHWAGSAELGARLNRSFALHLGASYKEQGYLPESQYPAEIRITFGTTVSL